VKISPGGEREKAPGPGRRFTGGGGKETKGSPCGESRLIGYFCIPVEKGKGEKKKGKEKKRE